MRDVGGVCDRCEGNAPVGAGHGKPALREIHVGRICFEQMRGDALALGHDLFCRAMQRTAADGNRPRARVADQRTGRWSRRAAQAMIASSG